MSDYGYDLECYPNIFTFCLQAVDSEQQWIFEISDRMNQINEIVQTVYWLRSINARMVGFNNIFYDYPMLHFVVMNAAAGLTPADIYNKSYQIIFAPQDQRHLNTIWDKDRLVEQLDLFKICHFDNKARSTSLKALEFAMRSDNVQDLPYEPGTYLTPDQMDDLRRYNGHDVNQTVKFYRKCGPAIKLREALSAKFNRNFMNHNDTKIGKDFFIMELENSGHRCFTDNRQPIQTPRPSIALKDVIAPYVYFNRPEFNAVLGHLKAQVITETKGVFKGLSADIDGFKFDFGTGGIHGSIESAIVTSTDALDLIDADVTSYYPSLAIVNKWCPEHMGDKFCEIYEQLFNTRKSYKKGTPENAVYKLALNGSYGDSNNQYSPFYDPKFTMSITINGQLLLCILSEKLLDNIPGLQMVQANTDGITVLCPRQYRPLYDEICQWWQDYTCLGLEFADYTKMIIRDVNNYIAVYDSGKVKRKGAYEYKRQWHQDQSALIVPMAAEAALVYGMDGEEFIRQHDDRFDFCLRAKIPRSSKLVLVGSDGNEIKQQNMTRYYVSQSGGKLVKLMPPINGNTEYRRIGINKDWNCQPCNNINNFNWSDLDYDFYISEFKKLTEIY